MTYYEEEPYYEPGQADTILSEFTEKMQAILTSTAKDKIAALEAQIENLLQQKKVAANEMDKIRSELGALKRNDADTDRKFAAIKSKSAALEIIEEILDVKTTHYVVSDWSGTRIYGIDDKTCNYNHHKRRALILVFDNYGRPEWRLSSYSDGSGGSESVIPCPSYEYAVEKARQCIADAMQKCLEEKKTASVSILKNAKEFGVEIPADYLASAIESERKTHAARVDEKRKSLQATVDDAQKVEAWIAEFAAPAEQVQQ